MTNQNNIAIFKLNLKIKYEFNRIHEQQFSM